METRRGNDQFRHLEMPKHRKKPRLLMAPDPIWGLEGVPGYLTRRRSGRSLPARPSDRGRAPRWRRPGLSGSSARLADRSSYGTVTVWLVENAPAEEVPVSVKVAEPAGTPANWYRHVLLVPALMPLATESGSLELVATPPRVAAVTDTLLTVALVGLVMITLTVTISLTIYFTPFGLTK